MTAESTVQEPLLKSSGDVFDRIDPEKGLARAFVTPSSSRQPSFRRYWSTVRFNKNIARIIILGFLSAVFFLILLLLRTAWTLPLDYFQMVDQCFLTSEFLLVPNATNPWQDQPASWPGHELLSPKRFPSLTSSARPKQRSAPPTEYQEKARLYRAAVGRQENLWRGNAGPHYDPHTGKRLQVDRKDMNLEPSSWKGPDLKVSELARSKKKIDNAPVQYRGKIDRCPHRVREERERRDWVKRAFLHAWEGYKLNAWGHDECQPISGGYVDKYNGWGATLVDNLDTLLIMGLDDEYEYAREFVAELDFGYLSPNYPYPEDLPALQDMELPTVENGGARTGRSYGWPKSPDDMPHFETVIRYLGGLLAAYDLSGDRLMLDRAIELGDWLLPALNTPSGLAIGRYNLGFNPLGVTEDYRSVLSEVGTLSMEFTRLSMLSGDEIYYRAVQRLTDTLDTLFPAGNVSEARLGQLLPSYLNPKNPADMWGDYTFGAMSDSYYEYLIKVAQLISDTKLTGQYAGMYAEAIDSAYDHLIRPVEVVPGHDDLVNIGWKNGANYIPRLEHLTCFAGGMLGLGAVLLNRQHDFETGRNYTQTCFWAYNSTMSGLMPEIVEFYGPNDGDRFTSQQLPNGTKIQEQAGTPPGVRNANPSHIGRPEAIESVFYMWRLTGNRIWQDKGWKMFTAWMSSSIVKHGFASVADVNSAPGRTGQTDSQESFVLAETLKYYYLLFSERDLIDLDDFVLNTEAHPFRIPRADATPFKALWKLSFNSKIDKIGEGSNVQKWGQVMQAAAFSKDVPIGA